MQGFDPWPGVSGHDNPIDVIVALDNLFLQADQRDSAGLPGGEPPTEVTPDDVVPRVPAMGLAGDYFLTPAPFVVPPAPDLKRFGFDVWRDAGVPTAQVQVQAGTHYEFSQLAKFPATPWVEGNAMAQHYAVAWFDRWLKQEGEEGFADADARLLDDVSWRENLSFYFRSARAFPDLAGTDRVCEDIRAGCDDRPADVVERVAGGDRIATGAAVARRTFERSDGVILARADDYADALVGGPLAGALGAPLLVTGSDGISEAVASVIEELDVRHAVLLGGEAALSAQVEADLEALHVSVRRVADDDRSATAAAVAEELAGSDAPGGLPLPVPGGDEVPVLLAEGASADPARGWPDALAAAGMGSVLGMPVLLTTVDRLPPTTAEQLEGREVLLVGGAAAVSDAVAEEVASLAASVRRIAGPDRYATSAAVIDEARDRGVGAPVVHVATGANWPDSLLAGAATGRAGGLLALVDPAGLDASTGVGAVLSEVSGVVESLRVVGGTSVLGEEVLTDLRGLR